MTAARDECLSGVAAVAAHGAAAARKRRCPSDSRQRFPHGANQPQGEWKMGLELARTHYRRSRRSTKSALTPALAQ
eukprot:CAMPEP_0170211732 /NCGR_PEP_ID=MMETSP0116_2-20130129/5482_1 /TAXON_ID=400756 /ORGANISM="Durinskia baltica, Strain CSIRO CS-38" /LENGTH=75 /DNA_ID=CAMNT_0010462267 /DNA_START=14 /DNA_END=238 /DNA_ORIENTATION=+